MFSKILVPSDGSPLSAKAADAAIAFARESGAELIVLSVAVMYPLLPEAGAMVDLNAFEEAARAGFDTVRARVPMFLDGYYSLTAD